MMGDPTKGGRIIGPFYKSTGSQNPTQCVEVAKLDNGGRAVRDSQHPDRGPLYFTAGEWSAFIAGAKRGEFD